MTTTQPTFALGPHLVAGKKVALALRVRADAGRAILRMVSRFAGTVFILCAPGLWLLPGANDDPSLLLWKLGLSIVFFVCGLAFFHWGQGRCGPEVQFDPVHREMRILQRNDRGDCLGVVRRAYDTLGAARITEGGVEIREPDGGILVRLPLTDPEARHVLRLQLGDLVR